MGTLLDRAQLGSGLIFDRMLASLEDEAAFLISGSWESFFILAGLYEMATVFPLGRKWPGGQPLENLCCLRCNRELEAGHKSVAVYMFAQTVGIRPRQKSAAQRICFCPQCSVSLAMGPPPEGALNIAAWNMIRDLVGSDPALNQAAWENLRGVVGLLAATGTDGPRRASTEGYFEF
ncbi:MAG TPA: hypothetical protein VNZ03_36135 [Terriglobales bacterium]|nr:hypothetical protein [Terriglobales bacterium]